MNIVKLQDIKSTHRNPWHSYADSETFQQRGGAVKALTPKARPFCDRQVGELRECKTNGNSEPHLLRALSCHFLLNEMSGNAGESCSDSGSDTAVSELTGCWKEQSLDRSGKLRISIRGVSLKLN